MGKTVDEGAYNNQHLLTPEDIERIENKILQLMEDREMYRRHRFIQYGLRLNMENTSHYSPERNVQSVQRSFYRNGQVCEECSYKESKRDGVWKSWFETGQLESECSYKEDKKDGVSKTWFETGKLESECYYKEGKADGVWRQWFENGQLESEYSYKEGKMDGVWRQWFWNGQLESEHSYKEGTRDGVWRQWFENGQLESEQTWKDGMKIVPEPATSEKRTEHPCLVYKDIMPPGTKYVECTFSEEHVVDHAFITEFSRTTNLKGIKCMYCRHPLKEEIFEQIE